MAPTVCVPVAGTIRLNVAIDGVAFSTVPVPWMVPSSVKLTVPEGSDVPEAAGVMVAVIASSAAYWRAGPVDRPLHFGVAWSGLWSVRDWVPWLQFLLHFITPVAIGWWFLRRRHDQGQLQLAS